ncbi:MAG: TRAP transporter large permease subunit, partial [Proteobacteria bacterium]|nr:TRAP transporter large permease subunit [Pseudomonadota bacterium]
MAGEPGEGRTFGLGAVVAAVAVAMSIYHLVTGYPGIGPPRQEIHYPAHLAFALAVLFGDDAVAALAARRYLRVAWDGALVLVLVGACAYLMLSAEYIASRFTYVEPLLLVEWVLGIGILVVVLEAARRTVGWVLIWLTLAFIVYALIGDRLPEPFYHQGFPLDRIIEQSYLTVDGIWNAPVAVAANFIFLFVLFGSLLLASGAGTFFTDLARALTGRTVGGPAKTAVVASAFFGMLSGSAAANVVTTGSFTIPAMKKV